MLIAKFNVFVEKKGVYYVARIYDTVEAMNAAIKKAMFADDDCIARCTSYDKISPDGKYSQEIGTVWFNQQNIGVGTVSHEFLHATFHWAEKVGLMDGLVSELKEMTVDNSIEERLCYAHGWMVKDFVSKCYNRKLYKN